MGVSNNSAVVKALCGSAVLVLAQVAHATIGTHNHDVCVHSASCDRRPVSRVTPPMEFPLRQ
jgi:hypothetical protein